MELDLVKKTPRLRLVSDNESSSIDSEPAADLAVARRDGGRVHRQHAGLDGKRVDVGAGSSCSRTE